MGRLGIAAALLLIATAAARAETPDPQKGTLVFSAGTVGGSFNFHLLYHTVGPGPVHEKQFRYSWGGSKYDHGLDFEGHETGLVWVEQLPPGDYEFYNFRIPYNVGIVEKRLHLRQPFSIPFTIKAGQSTYVGDFSCTRVEGKNVFGATETAGAYLVVSDKHERDIPVAQKLEPGLPPVTISVTDVSKLGEPYLLSKEPPATP